MFLFVDIHTFYTLYQACCANLWNEQELKEKKKLKNKNNPHVETEKNKSWNEKNKDLTSGFDIHRWFFLPQKDKFRFINHTMLGDLVEEFEVDGGEYTTIDGLMAE